MRKAIIESATGLVKNVILIDDGADWAIPDGCELVDASEAGGPGDTWDGLQFVPAPAVAPVMSEQDQAIKAAWTLNQLKAALLM